MTAAMTALQGIGVPYYVHGGRGFFQQPEIKEVLALLIAISDPTDTQALLRRLHLPAWAVSGKGRVNIVSACNEFEEPLIQLQGTDKLVLGDEDAARLEFCITTILELHERSMIDDVRDLFMEAIEVSEFLGVLELRRDLEKMQAGANLNKFGELLETFSDWSNDRSLVAALRYLNIMRNSTEADRVATIDPGEDAVALMTTHSAKGLEWPCVFISHGSASNWPAREIAEKPWAALPDELIPEPAPPGDSHPDEERRLFYVASTRAKDRLIYSWSKHAAYSGKNGEAFTPFLSDAGLKVTELPLDPSLHVGREPNSATPHVGRLALSVTELRTFRDCPRQFEYKVRYRMPVAKSVQGWYGNLVHSVLQVAGNMRRAGETVGGERVQQLWSEAWETTPGPKGAHPELREYGLNQLRSYVESPAFAGSTIQSIEDRFTIAFDAADVTGRFDRIDAGQDMPTVVDYKTGPVKDEERLESDIQARAYALGLHQREEVENVAVEMHFLQTAEVSRAEFDSKDLGRFYAHLRHITEDIASAWNGGTFPARPANFRCRRCEFRTICDEGKAAAAAN
jgi:ATP-dependent exoDNAse (exonuclease V) beta subunit